MEEFDIINHHLQQLQSMLDKYKIYENIDNQQTQFQQPLKPIQDLSTSINSQEFSSDLNSDLLKPTSLQQGYSLNHGGGEMEISCSSRFIETKSAHQVFDEMPEPTKSDRKHKEFGIRFWSRLNDSSPINEDSMIENELPKQIDNVQQYYDTFNKFVDQIPLSEEYALKCFIGGLNEDIQNEVKNYQPTTLHLAYCCAKLEELALHSFSMPKAATKPAFETKLKEDIAVQTTAVQADEMALTVAAKSWPRTHLLEALKDAIHKDAYVSGMNFYSKENNQQEMCVASQDRKMQNVEKVELKALKMDERGLIWHKWKSKSRLDEFFKSTHLGLNHENTSTLDDDSEGVDTDHGDGEVARKLIKWIDTGWKPKQQWVKMGSEWHFQVVWHVNFGVVAVDFFISQNRLELGSIQVAGFSTNCLQSYKVKYRKKGVKRWLIKWKWKEMHDLPAGSHPTVNVSVLKKFVGSDLFEKMHK